MSAIINEFFVSDQRFLIVHTNPFFSTIKSGTDNSNDVTKHV